MAYFGGSSGQVGDPGFFGSLFGAVKGAATGFVSGGPLGAIRGGARGAFARPTPRGPAVSLAPTSFQRPVGGTVTRVPGVRGGCSAPNPRRGHRPCGTAGWNRRPPPPPDERRESEGAPSGSA